MRKRNIGEEGEVSMGGKREDHIKGEGRSLNYYLVLGGRGSCRIPKTERER